MPSRAVEPHYHDLADLPGGWGPGKVVEAERLQNPAPGEGASHVGYDPTASGLPATNVQAAIDALVMGVAAAFKEPCQLATTGANIVLVGGAPNVLDTVPITSTTTRILVKDNIIQSENGLYRPLIIGTGANGTWVRTEDANDGGELVGMTFVGVQMGAPFPFGNAKTYWFVQTDGVIVIGVTPIVWALYPTPAIIPVNARRVIEIALGLVTVLSAAFLPAGGKVLRVAVEVSTPYSPGTTIDVGIIGLPLLFMAANENDPGVVNLYEKTERIPYGGSPVVQVAVGGGPVVGAASVLVEYTVPSP